MERRYSLCFHYKIYNYENKVTYDIMLTFKIKSVKLIILD